MKCIKRALLPPRLLPSSSYRENSSRNKLKDRIRRSFSIEDDPERVSISSSAPDECAIARNLSEIIIEHEWVRLHLDEPLPSPRSKHAAVTVGERVFVIGGISAEGLLGDFQVLDARAVAWSQIHNDAGAIQDAHAPRFVGHFVGKWKNMLVVLGGDTDFRTSALKVHAFDLETETWSSLTTSGEIPATRIGQSVVQVDSKLMMFGGEDASGRMLDEFYVLDLESFVWECPKTGGMKPAPRKYHAAGCHNGQYLWIFGGKSYATYFKDVFCLDLTKLEWTQQKTKGSLPQIARARHVGVMVEGSFYIVGGENRGQEMIDTLRLDVKKCEWSIVTMIGAMSPLAHDGLSVVRLEMEGRDYLVAFGGHGTLLSNQVFVMLVTTSKSRDSFGKRLSRSRSESGFPTTPRGKEMASPRGHFQLQDTCTSSSGTDLSYQTAPTSDTSEKRRSSVSERDLSSLARDGTLSMEDMMAMKEDVVRSDSNFPLPKSPLSRNGEKSAPAHLGGISEEFIVIEENAAETKGKDVASAARASGASGTKDNHLVTNNLVKGDEKGRSMRIPSFKMTIESGSPRILRLDSHNNQDLHGSSLVPIWRSTSKRWNSSETDQHSEDYLTTALHTVQELHRQIELLNKNKQEQEMDLHTRFKDMEAMAKKLEVTMEQQLQTEMKLQITLQLQKETQKKLQEVSQLQQSTENRYMSIKQQVSDVENQYRSCLHQKEELERHLKALAIRDDPNCS